MIGFDALKPCQWASSPSPRQDTMPIPVIHASRRVSAMWDRQQLAGNDEGSQLRLLDGGEEWHPLEFRRRDDEPARRLRHRLDEQHARHQGMTGKVALEDRALVRDLGVDLDR